MEGWGRWVGRASHCLCVLEQSTPQNIMGWKLKEMSDVTVQGRLAVCFTSVKDSSSLCFIVPPSLGRIDVIHRVIGWSHPCIQACRKVDREDGDKKLLFLKDVTQKLYIMILFISHHLLEVSHKYTELEVRLRNVVPCATLKLGNTLLLKEGRREWMLGTRIQSRKRQVSCPRCKM